MYILFSWIFDLIKTGRVRDLEKTDLHTTLDDYISSTLGDQLEKYINFDLKILCYYLHLNTLIMLILGHGNQKWLMHT